MTGSPSYLLCEQECRGGHCTKYPPNRGVDGSGSQEDSQTSEKLPYGLRKTYSAGPLIA